MNKKIIESLLTELNVTPKENSQLNEFLVRLDAKDNADGVSNERFSEASIHLESSTSTETDQITFGHLKRLQTIRFSRLILDLAIKAESLSDLKEAQASGVEKIINLPDSTTAKLLAFNERLSRSFETLNELKAMATGDLVNEFKLVAPPTGLQVSLLMTLIFAAITVLSFVILTVNKLIGSTDAYWIFFVGGMAVFVSANAVVINLIKRMKFKKNKKEIFLSAKRKFIEDAELRHLKLKQYIEGEAFRIQMVEITKASQKKLSEFVIEEKKILEYFDANPKAEWSPH